MTSMIWYVYYRVTSYTSDAMSACSLSSCSKWHDCSTVTVILHCFLVIDDGLCYDHNGVILLP